MKEVAEPKSFIKLESYESQKFVDTVAATFWVFNALYVVGISLIAGPMLLDRLWESVAQGNAPAHQVVVILLAMAVPLLAVGFAYLSQFNKDNSRLSEFFVGVELPLVGILLGRSVWAHELSPTAIGLYCFLLSVAACQCWLLVRRKSCNLPLYRAPSQLTTAASALVAIGGLYFSALAIVFISPALVGAFVLSALAVVWAIPGTFVFPLAILGIPLGIGLFLVAVYVTWLVFYVPYCFVTQWRTRLKRAPGIAHRNVSVTMLVLCVSGFVLLQGQSRTGVLNKLSQDQSDESVQSQLLIESKTIRTDLTDAFLSPIRYISDDFGFRTRNPAMQLRNGALKLLLPTLVYPGDPYADRHKAMQQYESFFDVPIERAERHSIMSAHKNHWTPNRELSAGLLDIGQRTVHVESQKIDVSVTEGVATVTVQEVLRNTTSRTLETLQYFTLPEEAVVTGLWLSDTVAEPEMFAFQVAPRGAAQQVYQEQVRISVDPALLELVGPRQYRLRVFPVVRNTPMVVTMTYRTLPDKNGNWPLPQLLEQRNIYWDDHTSRTVNNEESVIEESTHWFPQTLASTMPAASTSNTLAVVQGDRLIYAEDIPIDTTLSNSDQVAVLVDGSYSMGDLQHELQDSLAALKGAEFFFCKEKCVTTDVHAIDEWVFYGNSQPLQQLREFESEIGTNAYDAIFVLSDGGTYELQRDESALTLRAPTWLVELGGSVHAYHDSLSDTLRSTGGEIVQSTEQAILKYQTLASADVNSMQDKVVTITPNHIWRERATDDYDNSNTQLTEIVAALKIKQLSEANNDNEALDALHEIALDHGIVSNYSSMIVLVNDQQRNRLKDLTSREDRFNREVETGKRRMQRRVATAVPEPHEWALMGLALLLLLYSAHRQGHLSFVGRQLPLLSRSSAAGYARKM